MLVRILQFLDRLHQPVQITVRDEPCRRGRELGQANAVKRKLDRLNAKLRDLWKLGKPKPAAIPQTALRTCQRSGKAGRNSVERR